MTIKELLYEPITNLAPLIESRQVSPVELTEAYLERIEKLNEQLNAYITVCGDEAMASARQAETEIGRVNIVGLCTAYPLALRTSFSPRASGLPSARGYMPTRSPTRTPRSPPGSRTQGPFCWGSIIWRSSQWEGPGSTPTVRRETPGTRKGPPATPAAALG